MGFVSLVQCLFPVIILELYQIGADPASFDKDYPAILTVSRQLPSFSVL
jgi:hypothetical protein